MKAIYSLFLLAPLLFCISCESKLTREKAHEIILYTVAMNDSALRKAVVGRLEIPNEGDREIQFANNGFGVGVDVAKNIYDFPNAILNAIREIGHIEHDAYNAPYAYYSDSLKEHIERIKNIGRTTIETTIKTYYRFEGIAFTNEIGPATFDGDFPQAVIYFSLISHPFSRVQAPRIEGSVTFHKEDGIWKGTLLFPKINEISDAMKQQILEAYKN